MSERKFESEDILLRIRKSLLACSVERGFTKTLRDLHLSEHYSHRICG
jgi:hypothetical protein